MTYTYLSDVIERKEIGETMFFLVPFTFVQQIQRLVRWQHQRATSGIGKNKHEFHLHTDIVPPTLICAKC